MKDYVHKVQYYETDKMGITHHSNYIRFMEEARTALLAELGWNYKKLEELGIFSPVISVSCNFKKSTTYEDEISIQTKILELSQARLKIGYTLTANGNIICTAESCHCFLNESGRPISLKRVNPEFYNVLEQLSRTDTF